MSSTVSGCSQAAERLVGFRVTRVACNLQARTVLEAFWAYGLGLDQVGRRVLIAFSRTDFFQFNS